MSASSKIPALVSGAAAFHEQGITGKEVTIAIMDSGLAPHKEIDTERILTFEDFVYNRKILYDDFTHGTHVTGIAAAGKLGIAPASNLVILKVLDNRGNSETDLLLDAIKCCFT